MKIKRNKKMLQFVLNRINDGHTAESALKEVGKSDQFNLSYHVAKALFYKRQYPNSPWFEYDKVGNVVYELDFDLKKIPGTETKHFQTWAKSQTTEIA
ncbi:MAG: hypothetical protein AAF634_04995 [Bacteroidota bacterium]